MKLINIYKFQLTIITNEFSPKELVTKRLSLFPE